MERVELHATHRSIAGKQVRRLRNQGWVPAILYGRRTEALPLQIEEKPLNRALDAAGSTALIDLIVEEASPPRPVLAREIQRHILTGRVQHVDFMQVQLDRKIKTTPALIVDGESPLVKSGAGVLVQILNHVEVECLPGDLIDAIHVDVSGLERLDDSITVGDLRVPPGITILTHATDTVISVVPPRAALTPEEEGAAPEPTAGEEEESGDER